MGSLNCFNVIMKPKVTFKSHLVESFGCQHHYIVSLHSVEDVIIIDKYDYKAFQTNIIDTKNCPHLKLEE